NCRPITTGGEPPSRTPDARPWVITTNPPRPAPLLPPTHSFVAGARKLGPHPVAGFQETATADAIRDDQIIFCAIERLPTREELTAKIVKNGFSAAVGAVQQQHGIRDPARRISLGHSERYVVLAKFR